MTVGKYCLGQTIGEGTFAKVKVAVDVETNRKVAIKIIDKAMIRQKNLMDQVLLVVVKQYQFDELIFRLLFLLRFQLMKVIYILLFEIFMVISCLFICVCKVVREISLMKVLHHPNIVQIYEVLFFLDRIQIHIFVIPLS